MRNLLIFFALTLATTTATAQIVETAFSKCNCEKQYNYKSLQTSNIDIITHTKTDLEIVFVWNEKKVVLNGKKEDISYITEDESGKHVYFMGFHFLLEYVYSDTEGAVLVSHKVLN